MFEVPQNVRGPQFADGYLLLRRQHAGLGSWANTQKLSGKARWPFQLFYWDYAIGVLLCTMVFTFTLGSHGPAGMSALANSQTMTSAFVLPALISGVIFNLSNIIFVVGIDSAGMVVAFPIGVGLSLVLGTAFRICRIPKANRRSFSAASH